MTLEMQRLYLKEILDVLNNYDRIMNKDCSKIKDEIMNDLVDIHSILVKE